MVDVRAGPGPDRAAAARALVAACEEQGFFRVTGHGMPQELVRAVEAAAAGFFYLQQAEKEGGVGEPVGYGCKQIGHGGDLGSILLCLTSAGTVCRPRRSCSRHCLARPWPLPPPPPLTVSSFDTHTSHHLHTEYLQNHTP
nr:gibberellin 2-beta-dioxygenase 1-like [Lolium perenne]